MRSITIGIISFLLTSMAVWSSEYEVIELHPYWTYESVATDINEQGEIVGWLKASTSAPFREVFFYNKKKKHHFPNIDSVTSPVINENGTLGGTAIVYKYFIKAHQYPFTWNEEEKEVKVSIPKDWKENSTYLQDLNNDGEILLTNSATKETSTNVVLITKKGERSIPKLTFGKKMNVLAFIAGSIVKNEKSYPASYTRTHGKSHELLSSLEGEAVAVNDADDVVGVMIHKGQPLGFFYSTMLSTPLPLPQFIPVDINIHLQILGYQLDEEGGGPYAAIWSKGTVTRLGLQVDENIEVVQVTAINNDGMIVGSIKDRRKDWKERAALFKPKKKK